MLGHARFDAWAHWPMLEGIMEVGGSHNDFNTHDSLHLFTKIVGNPIITRRAILARSCLCSAVHAETSFVPSAEKREPGRHHVVCVTAKFARIRPSRRLTAAKSTCTRTC